MRASTLSRLSLAIGFLGLVSCTTLPQAPEPDSDLLPQQRQTFLQLVDYRETVVDIHFRRVMCTESVTQYLNCRGELLEAAKGLDRIVEDVPQAAPHGEFHRYTETTLTTGLQPSAVATRKSLKETTTCIIANLDKFLARINHSL